MAAGDRERPVRALRRRVATLESEIDALRSALRAAGIVVPPAADSGEPISTVESTTPAPIVVAVKPTLAEDAGLPLTSYLRERRDECHPEVTALKASEPASAVPAAIPPRHAVTPPPRLPLPQPLRQPRPHGGAPTIDLERFVGAKLVAWVGAVAVLAAVAFFLKLAFDRGWLGLLSPEVRLIAAYAFAAALVATGEVALRRYGRAGAVGLFAAGVGSFYLATLAASWPLDVLSPTLALGAATVVAVLGALLTLRSKMLSVGVVSILGGLAAPLVLGVITRDGLLPPTHLTILLAIGLVLAAVSPVPFLALRFVSVIGTVVTGAIWFLAIGHRTPALAIIVFAAWWAMTAAEAIVAALRGRSPRANAASMLVMSFAIATVAGIDAAAPSPWSSAYSYVPLALAFLSLGAVFQFGTGLDSLRPLSSIDRSDAVTDDERALAAASRTLGVALWAQFGLLFVAGLGVFLRHGALAVAWVATGVFALELARRLRSLPTAMFGVIVLGLGAAAAAISSIVRAMPATRPPIGHGWWLHLPPGWTGGAMAVAALAFVAWRWSRPSEVASDSAPIDSLGVRGADLSTRLAFIAPACGVVFTVMWLVGSGLRAGPCLALALMLVPAIFFALAFRHERLRWPSVLAVLSLGVLIVAWMVMRLPDVLGRREVVALIAPPLAAVGVLWLLAARYTERLPQERLLVTSVLTIALIAGFEIFADVIFIDTDGTRIDSPRLRSDVATVVLGAVGVIAMVLGRAGRFKLVSGTGAVLTLFAAFVWCLFGTAIPRFDGVFDEPLVINATVGAALFAILAVAIAFRCRAAYVEAGHVALEGLPSALATCLVILPIWLVSFVIDAVLDPVQQLAADGTPRQAALSAWWGVSALALIALGFAKRTPELRYAGLVGLAVVAAKVLLVDMQGAGTIWRVVGLLAAGLLMVATSIVYVRVGKVLDGNQIADDASRP